MVAVAPFIKGGSEVYVPTGLRDVETPSPTSYTLSPTLMHIGVIHK